MLADAVISRLSRVFDVPALSALAEGVQVNLDDQASAEASAKRLHDALHDATSTNGVDVTAELEEDSGKYRLVIRRMHHGNVRISIIDADFVRGADYAILAKSAQTFLA